MANKDYLDKKGLIYLWSKIKNYIEQRIGGANLKNGYKYGYLGSLKYYEDTSNTKACIIIPVISNETYLIKKAPGGVFDVATFTQMPSNNSWANLQFSQGSEQLAKRVITPGINDGYIVIYFWNSLLDTMTLQEMYDSIEIYSNYVDTSTPSNELLELLYPIGRGFIDFTDIDYSNYLGLTWEREVVGMFPVGYDPNDSDFNEIGKTGGEKTHTLTVDELAKHTHTQKQHRHSSSSMQATLANGQKDIMRSATQASAGSAAAQYTAYTTAVNEDTGGGQPHNNVPPYKVVAYWKRIA